MVKEKPVSVVLIFLIVVVAIAGQANKEKNNLVESEIKTQVPSDSYVTLILALVVLSALTYVLLIRGQPWKRR